MARGRRKCTEIESMFPETCEEVVATLIQVSDHEAKTQKDQISAEAPLAYHQVYSAPLMTAANMMSKVASLPAKGWFASNKT